MSDPTLRVPDDDDQYVIPPDIIGRAVQSTRAGQRVTVTPSELIDALLEADEALNGESNDDEHDALVSLRETLSAWFEDNGRRM